MEVTKEQKNIIKNSLGHIIEINDRKYYVKRCDSSCPYLEIVAEKLAKILDIPSIHYEAVKDEYEIYYLSEVICENNEFLTGKNIHNYLDSQIENPSYQTSYSLYDIWKRLDEFLASHINSEKLVQENMLTMVKIFLFDIMFMNPDRTEENWVLINRDGNPLVYMFDSEYIFSKTAAGVVLSSKLSYADGLDSYHDFDSINELGLQELEYYLNESSEEFIDLFSGMLEKVTPSVLEKVFEDVEEEVKDKLPKTGWLKMYKENYENMKKLLEIRGKNGKRVH